METNAQNHEVLLEPISGHIASKFWLISEEGKSFFQSFLAGKLASRKPEMAKMRALVQLKGEEQELELGVSKAVAVIMTDDVLYRSLRPNYGVEGLCSMLHECDEHDEISSIIIKASISGGDEGSTEMLARAIQACKKPVYFYINYGVALSGGYWAASACKGGIYASRKTDRVGGIGSYFSIMQEGKDAPYKMVDIYSSLSPNKNAEHRAAQEGNYKPYVKMADKIATAFHDAIRENRPKIQVSENDNPFEGASYMATDALENGLIDGICSFDELLLLASKEANSIANNQSTNMLGYTKAPKLMALLAMKAATLTDDALLNEANAELAEKGDHGFVLVKQDELEALLKNDAFEAEKTALETEVTNLKAQLTAKDAEIAKLNAAPGAVPTAPVKKEEKIEKTEQTDSKAAYFSTVDEELAKMKSKMAIQN